MASIEELKKEIELLKSQLEEKNQKIKELEALNSYYMEQLKLRAKEKYGKSSEKAESGEISFDEIGSDFFNEPETLREPIMNEPKEEILEVKKVKPKRKKNSKYKNLETETVEYRLADDELKCENCGCTLTEMKKEIRKELVVIPAKVKVIEHITYVYSCRNCQNNGTEAFIKKADSPKALIEKSIVSPSLMSHIISQKYTVAVPLYRQEQEFKRYGIEISRQNLCSWIIKGADLLKPLLQEIKSELLANEFLHADETTLEVLKEPGRETASKSYMWLYRTSAYADKPVIIFDYHVGRSGKFAEEFLEDWKGRYLHCDGYSGYKILKDKILCGCWVHAKRKFHEAKKSTSGKSKDLAETGEKYIQKLFAVEKIADEKNLSFEERLVLRNSESKKIIEEFYAWIDSVKCVMMPKSAFGTALTYAKNQKEYLCSFLKDGHIQLSNNLAEQSIKLFVIGRKNWLFSSSTNGAESSALLYSIIQTAIANGLKPQHYLEYVFTQIQYKNKNLKDLLPWSDKIPQSCKK